MIPYLLSPSSFLPNVKPYIPLKDDSRTSKTNSHHESSAKYRVQVMYIKQAQGYRMWLRQRKGYYGSMGLTRGPQNSGRLKRLKRSFDLMPTSLSTIKHICTLLPYQCITLMCIAQFILQVISYRHNMSSISLILTKLTHIVPVK